MRVKNARAASGPRKGIGFRRTWIISLAGLALAWIGVVAREPNLDLHFERIVPISQKKQAQAVKELSNPATWAAWFYSTSEVKAPQGLKPNASIELSIDPHKGEWKKFRVQLEVISWKHTPNEAELTLRLLGDSKGKIQKTFENIEWQILVRDAKLIARARAHTRSWRSRLMGRLAEPIVMNQLLYANLMRLAEILSLPEGAKTPPLPGGIRLSPND